MFIPGFRKVIPSVLVLLLLFNISFTSSTRIEYDNGVYESVLLALHNDAPIASCKQLIADIKAVFIAMSSKLNTATNSKGTLGLINILLPKEWDRNAIELNCELLNSEIVGAKHFQSYELADIKITVTHPIAKTLPWTKQYRGCGWGAEAIYIPTNFLQSSIFNVDTKGHMLLHEWAKFRYGVFEEFGFFDDEYYSPCYVRGGKHYFSTCSNIDIELLNIGSSDDSCKTNVDNNAIELALQLSQGASSIMSAPHLSNVVNFCSNEPHPHNSLSNNKHNFYCNRKSVSEVVMSHPDFKGFSSSKGRKGSTLLTRTLQQTEPSFQFMHPVQKKQGYAFLIEDSLNIRELHQLKHVKQAITQMIHMLPDGTEVLLCRFSGSVSNCGVMPDTLLDVDDKKKFVEKLPDLLTASSSNQTLANQRMENVDLDIVFNEAISVLDRHQSFQYNIILVSSNSPNSIQNAIVRMSNAMYSLSVMTFDDSPEWLLWNTIANTRKVIYLPICFEGGICNTKTSSLMTDHLLEILSDQQPRRFFHKVAEAEIIGQQSTFSIENSIQNLKNFIIVFPVFLPSAQAYFTAPDGSNCNAANLLDYSDVKATDAACTFQTGIWTLHNVQMLSGAKHFLQVYVETEGNNEDLIVSSSLGHNLDTLIFPAATITPVYVSVTNKFDHPIIEAEVEIDLFSTNFIHLPNSKQILRDDGIDPDVTRNDGVYSTYLQGYSSTLATHVGQVLVRTSATKSKSIVSSNSTSAGLLDTNMSSKCCGSSVHFDEIGIEPVGETSYSILLPSFKTGSTFEQSSYPPSKIMSTEVLRSEDERFVTLNFLAPGAYLKEGVVDHYEICCVGVNDPSTNLDDSTCRKVMPNPDDTNSRDCQPVSYGYAQTCKVYQQQLLQDFVDNSDNIPSGNESIYLSCGVRGVNEVKSAGGISGTLVEIEVYNENAADLKCKSISDGCLPIAVFWGLIGCLSGLVLILIIIIICWFCMSRKSQEEKKPTVQNGNNAKVPVDGDPHSYNVYVNQAYIQESEGQLKLVASEGELLPFNTNERYENRNNTRPGLASNPNSITPLPSPTPIQTAPPFPTAVRRRSISANANESRNQIPDIDSISKKHVSWDRDDGSEINAWSYTDNRGNDNNENTFTPNLKMNQINPKSVEYNSAIPTPKPKDRIPRIGTGHGYANGNSNGRSETEISTPIPSISSVVDTNKNKTNRNNNVSSFMNNNNNWNPSGPIYASVNRNGRRMDKSGTDAHVGSFRNGSSDINYSVPIITAPVNTFRSRNNKPGVYPPGVIQNRFNNRPSTSSTATGVSSPAPSLQHFQPKQPVVRMDRFPSSESDSYSDKSRGIPIPPPPPIPPPFPTSAEFSRNVTPRGKVSSNNRNPHRNMDGNNRINIIASNPKTTARTPPKENGFAGHRGFSRDEDDQVFQQNRPRGGPPAPPPRHDRRPVSPQSNRSTHGSGSRAPEDDDYDEGSDHWDDGDDSDNPGGVSYA